jgi:hypothetical protein
VGTRRRSGGRDARQGELDRREHQYDGQRDQPEQHDVGDGEFYLSSGTGTVTLGAATLADSVTLTIGAGAATPINLSSVSGTAVLPSSA